jgi:hypothetical protein
VFVTTNHVIVDAPVSLRKVRRVIMVPHPPAVPTAVRWRLEAPQNR